MSKNVFEMRFFRPYLTPSAAAAACTVHRADHQKIFVPFLQMAEALAQTQTSMSTSTPTIQVRLKTGTEAPISTTPIVVPTNVTRYNSLSQILNTTKTRLQP